MGMTIYVSNIDHQTREADLRELFAQYGTIQRAELMTDVTGGISRLFGVIELATESEAQAAIAGLNGKTIDGRTLTVSETGPRSG